MNCCKSEIKRSTLENVFNSKMHCSLNVHLTKGSIEADTNPDTGKYEIWWHDFKNGSSSKKFERTDLKGAIDYFYEKYQKLI